MNQSLIRKQQLLKEKHSRDKPSYLIAQELGLGDEAIPKITHAKNGLRQGGKLSRPTEEEKTRTLREAQYHAHHSSWPYAASFEALGLLATEITKAIEITYGLKFEVESVRGAAKQARSMEGRQKNLSPQEKAKLVKETRWAEQPLEERVPLWLDTIATLLLDGNTDDWPNDRDALKSLANRYEIGGLASRNGEKWKQIVALFHRNGSDLPRTWTKENISNTVDFVRLASEDESVRTLRAKLPDVELPENVRYTRFLAELIEKASYFKDEGIWSLKFAPSLHLQLDEKPIDVIKKIAVQVRAIQVKYGFTDDQLRRLLSDL
jgi:hypothetical protein